LLIVELYNVNFLICHHCSLFVYYVANYFLTGDICDRWLDVKNRTGFVEMTDPKFVHYLLRLEETRQERMNAIEQTAQQHTGRNVYLCPSTG